MSFNAIENGIVSKIPFLKMLYGILDSKINNYMSRKIVFLLLEAYGYQVMDMTEHNGLTYFHSQKVRSDYDCFSGFVYPVKQSNISSHVDYPETIQ
jgi:hypothetical protein